MNLSFDTHLNTGHFGTLWSGVLTQKEKKTQKVAIKVVKEAHRNLLLNADFFLRYLHEDATASFWIVKRFTILKDCENNLALVTEFIESSLKKLLETKKEGLSLEQTGQIAKQVAGAFSFLDKMDVIYPNLHPESILLCGDKVKLGNFQQAYFKESCANSKLLVGSSYISPEVLLGDPFSPFASVWALAQITSYMFTKILHEFPKEEEALASFPVLLEAPYLESFIETATAEGKEIYEKSLKVKLPSMEPLKELIERISGEKGEDPKKTQELLDLLFKMLAYQDRISAQEILSHPFLKELPIDEYTPSLPLDPKLEGVFSNYSFLAGGSFGSVYTVKFVKEGKIQGNYVVKKSKLNELGKIDLRSKQSILNEDRFLRLLQKDPKGASFFAKRHKIFESDDRIHLVLDRKKLNLAQYIHFKKGLSLEQVRCYAQQLLKALDFISEKGIIHLDLKPANIFVSQNEKNVVIGDFGSSCFQEEVYHPSSTYQITRWYRGPEVILEVPLTTACDIWSLKTSLIESYIGIGPFETASQPSLLKLQEQRLGKYPSSLLDQASEAGREFYEKCSLLQVKFQSPLSVFISFYSLTKMEDPRKVSSFISFVLRGLEMDPEKRPSAKDLLTDPFICDSHSENCTIS